jgi:hypothetical protein
VLGAHWVGQGNVTFCTVAYDPLHHLNASVGAKGPERAARYRRYPRLSAMQPKSSKGAHTGLQVESSTWSRPMMPVGVVVHDSGLAYRTPLNSRGLRQASQLYIGRSREVYWRTPGAAQDPCTQPSQASITARGGQAWCRWRGWGAELGVTWQQHQATATEVPPR